MTTQVEQIKSPYRIKLDKRNLGVFFRYQELTSLKRSMSVSVSKTIQKEFGIYGDATVFKIVRRVKNELPQLLADYPEFNAQYLKYKNQQS